MSLALNVTDYCTITIGKYLGDSIVQIDKKLEKAGCCFGQGFIYKVP